MSEPNGPQPRPQLLGRMTQRAVLEALRANGPLSRADVTRLTGISATTIGSAVESLTRSGWVEEADDAPRGGRTGRPARPVRLARTRAQALGVSIDLDGCEVVAGGLDGVPDPARAVRFATPASYAGLLSAVVKHAKAFSDDPAVRTFGVGVSLPGLIDRAGERAVFSPNLHLTDGKRPAHDLAERLGVPAVLVHEPEALCLAEARRHRTADLAVIDYSGGLGVGVMAGGRLLSRHLGLPCELGHVTVEPDGEPCGCGNRGCLETAATDAALARRLGRALGEELGVGDAVGRVRAGGLKVDAELDRAVDFLAVAAAAAVNLYGSPLVVLHGRFLDARPGLTDELADRARRRVFAPAVLPTRFAGSRSTKAEGALAGVLHHLFEELGPPLPAGLPS